MQRLLWTELLHWKIKPKRSPLILRGARQVGKTFLVQKFAIENFEHFVEINFERQPEYKSFFNTLDPQAIIRSLEVFTRKKIIPGSTLLFLDEIQECPEAIQVLRYFKEEVPDLHVITAGSLLEFVLHDAKFSMPVGRIEYLYLKPFSFKEFLLATGEKNLSDYLQEAEITTIIPEPVHQQLLRLVDVYLLIGGMPAVVDSYLNTSKNFSECAALQSALLQSYRDDFGKYAQKTSLQNLQKIFTRLPHVIAQQFKYVDLDRELRSEVVREAIERLSYAGLVNKVAATSASGLPLIAHANEKKFKLLFLDVGLCCSAMNLTPEVLWNEQALFVNRGLIFEQFVGQELMTLLPAYQPAELFYWQRDKQGSLAEVDYVMSMNGYIVPIEVKAGHSNRLKSLQILMTEKKLPLGIRISKNALSVEDNLLSIPLYMISELPRLLQEALFNN